MAQPAELGPKIPFGTDTSSYTVQGSDVDIYNHGNHSVPPREMARAALNLWLPGAITTGFDAKFRGELLPGEAIIETSAFDRGPFRRDFQQSMISTGSTAGVRQTLISQVLEPERTLDKLPRTVFPPRNKESFIDLETDMIDRNAQGEQESLGDIIRIFEAERLRMLAKRGLDLTTLMKRGIFVVVTRIQFEPRAEIPARTPIHTSSKVYFDNAIQVTFQQVMTSRNSSGEITQLTECVSMERDETGEPHLVPISPDFRRRLMGDSD